MKTLDTKKWLATGCLLIGAEAALADFTPTINAHDFGEVFIPRDAPIGSQIAQKNAGDRQESEKLRDDGKPLVNDIRIGPRLPAIVAAASSIDSANKGDHLYDSGVPGIGIAIRHGPSNGLCDLHVNMLLPESKFMPFSGRICRYTGQGTYYINSQIVYLVKTGEIAAGRHMINKELYQISFDGTPFATGTMSAGVTVSGCELPPASKQITVELGDHDQQVFSPSGKSPSVDFTIPVHGCIAGTYPPNTNWNYFTGNYANLKLEPARGSDIIDAANGVLSLKPDSSAGGIAVQILKSNRTPMPLGQEVRLNPVENGTTLVELKAQYVRRASLGALRPGTANASANFTLTFK